MMESDRAHAPKRRWSYSLWTLFAVVTVLACWVGFGLNWIRQRHALLARHEVIRAGLVQRAAEAPGDLKIEIGKRIPIGVPLITTPWALRIFGEEAVESIDFAFYATEGQTRPSDQEWREVELCRSLFPEAQIEWRLLIPKTER